MSFGRNIVEGAQRMLHRQLGVLSRLASAALRLVEATPRRPTVDALEKAVRTHARVAWALRLIDALRAKLAGDLIRVERGEALEELASVETKPRRLAAERLETLDRERLDRESFGRLPPRGDHEFAAILQRPTDEIIALIAKELGLSPDWPIKAAQAWEEDEALDAPVPLDGARVRDGRGAVSSRPPPL